MTRKRLRSSLPVLTHSDWTPDNVLVSPERTWLIDWARPTLGAAWTDPACWVLRLMASGGHAAHEAERQASRLPCSRPLTQRTLTCSPPPTPGCGTRPQSSTSDWTAKMAQAAKSWTAHRQAH
ncbi:MAG TPA: phosphotransferase [Trebonia sp.]|nr:phosphotransferase [Trebonia sp.]